MGIIQSPPSLPKFPKRMVLGQVATLALSTFFSANAIAQDMVETLHSQDSTLSLQAPSQTDRSVVQASEASSSPTPQLAEDGSCDSGWQSDRKRQLKVKKLAAAEKKKQRRSETVKVMDMQIVPPLPTLQLSDKINPFRGTGIYIKKPMMTIPR